MNYFKELSGLFSKITVIDGKGHALRFDKAISGVVNELCRRARKNNKAAIIGNGGSAAIASHIAIDLLKNCGIPAIAFNDASFLTCISNDLGYEHVFEKPVDMLAREGDVLFAISSSGKSANILNAARKAREKGCLVVTLSGFNKDNPLRRAGEVNFYVPSISYGYVEIIHLAICHVIVDSIMSRKK